MAGITAKVHKDMNIGDVINLHPDAVKVIEKYFGSGCFTCPGIKMESLSFGAMMHGMKVETLVDELNKVITGS